MSVLSLRPKLGQPRSETPTRASIQATTLDLLWISGGVVCFAGPRPDAALYRAILVLAGPSQTPHGLAESGVLAGYRAMLGGLEHPVQILVRPEPFDAASEAARWDARAAALPPPLAELAGEHAAWVRRELASARLLVRRAYLVVPAEGAATDARPDWRARARLGSRPAPTLVGGEEARAVLAERCEQLSSVLAGAGVAARRLDDLALARLYRDCWGTRGSAGDRLDRDLAALFSRSA